MLPVKLGGDRIAPGHKIDAVADGLAGDLDAHVWTAVVMGEIGHQGTLSRRRYEVVEMYDEGFDPFVFADFPQKSNDAHQVAGVELFPLLGCGQGVGGQGRRDSILEAGGGKLAVKGGGEFRRLGVPALGQFAAAQYLRRPCRVIGRP